MKLKALKGDLKKWNETEFGNVTIKRIKLWNDLNTLDSKEERVSLSVDEKRDKERICLEIERTALLEEISWRQKSRVLWLREGDSNMKFFHQMANSNRKNNSIGSLNIDVVLTSDQEIIEEGIVRF